MGDPGREALVECATGRRWSYPELVADVDACALGLAGLGVGKGDRVGIWASNCAEFCSGRLAHFKIPRYVKLVDEFPMTVTGKIRKVEMRQVSVDELGL